MPEIEPYQISDKVREIRERAKLERKIRQMMFVLGFSVGAIVRGWFCAS